MTMTSFHLSRASELFVEQSQDSLPVMEADSALLLLKHYDPVVCIDCARKGGVQG